MSTLGLMLTLFTTLIFTSCQVKETTGSGLISDHQPTTNKFTVQTPTSKTYATDETVSINVSFPFNIIIDTTGGTPRLRLTIGSTTRYASYVIGSNPRVLNFEYTFQAGDNDSNGIDVLALELNGSTLTFDDKGTITNCDVATVITTNFSLVKVDTTGPTVSSFMVTNSSGFYNVGSKLTFRMTYNEAVYVTGVPSFELELGGNSRNPSYVSGSGTTTLIFEYTVASTDIDTNGFDGITSPLDLNSGTIKDVVGNDASLDFSAYIGAVLAVSTTIGVNGQLPYIVDAAFPSNGTYLAGQTINFVFEFDRTVNVTGSPSISVTIGSTVRTIPYTSGTGTKFISFQYLIVPGDVDTDGITVGPTITQNPGGNIRDTVGTAPSFFADASNNQYPTQVTSGIIINAVQPQAISVTRNADTTNAVWGTAVDNIWTIGQDLFLTVVFNDNVYVNQTLGTPSVSMTIGSTTRQASYVSGHGQDTLVFHYIIQEGDLDTDNTIALNGINLNGGTISDAANNNILTSLPVAGLTTTRVDGVRPTISNVAAPANNTYSTITGNNHTSMLFTVTWSEAVNLSATGTGAAYLPMTVGATSTPLQYASGNNTTSTVHRAASLATLNDNDGVTLTSPFAGTATIKDQAGNQATVLTYTPPVTTSIFVDTTAPQVTDVTPITANGTYTTGDDLDFTVTFDEAVTTNVSGGYPRIPINIGGTTYYLLPTANTTSTTHTFSYTIVSNQVDTNGVVLTNSVSHLGTGYVRDAGQNLSTGTFTLPNTSGILVDSEAPTVDSVSKTTDGTYEAGDDLSINVTYSEDVTVDTTGGTPRIQVTIGSSTRNFQYVSGTGTDTLVFTYTLTTNDFDPDGLASSVSTISMNGGTIEDVGGNSVPTTFTAQNLSSVFVMYPNTQLWVQSNFVNKARAGSPTVSNSGVVSTEACGSSTCRTFDGDDALNLTSALNGVESLFIVFKTPPSPANHDIFGADVTLIDGGATFDLATVNADINLDGTPDSGTNFNVDMTTSSTHVLQVDLGVAQNYGAQTLIDTTFDGALGEIIAVTGTLTPAQKTEILNYLSNKY